MGWLNGKISEFDVSSMVNTGHMIPHYYYQPAIACWVAPWLYYSDNAATTDPATAVDSPSGMVTKNPTDGS